MISKHRNNPPSLITTLKVVFIPCFTHGLYIAQYNWCVWIPFFTEFSPDSVPFTTFSTTTDTFHKLQTFVTFLSASSAWSARSRWPQQRHVSEWKELSWRKSGRMRTFHGIVVKFSLNAGLPAFDPIGRKSYWRCSRSAFAHKASAWGRGTWRRAVCRNLRSRSW